MAALNIKFAVEVNGVKKEIPVSKAFEANKDNPNNMTLLEFLTNFNKDIVKVDSLYFYHSSFTSDKGEKENLGVYKVGSDGIIYLKIAHFFDDEVQSSNFNLNNLNWEYYKTKYKADEIKTGIKWDEIFSSGGWEIATVEEFANGGSISGGNEPEFVYVYVGTLVGYKIYKGVVS